MLALVELASGRPAEIAAAPLMLDPIILARARSLLPDGPRYVALAPGAGGRHKCWPLDRYIALAERLKAKGAVPVFILGPGEAEWVAECREVAGAVLPLQQTDGPASAELTIALARRCSAAVANDSGAGHLIAAADIPLVSLFGPTAPDKFAPMTRQLTIVRAQDLGGEAMDAITVDAVAKALG
jgi:ADP-heptose:LPS heptosyltransferase